MVMGQVDTDSKAMAEAGCCQAARCLDAGCLAGFSERFVPDSCCAVPCRSLHSIPTGGQLTISYIELAATRQERRRQLLKQYFFDIDQRGTQQQQQQQQPPAEHAAAESAVRLRSSRLQGSGLQKLQLLVQLPQWQRQQQSSSEQELLLWSSCGGQLAGSQAGVLPAQQQAMNGHTHCSGTSSSSSSRSNNSRPPWAHDTPDPQLCQMLLLQPADTTTTDSSSSSRGHQQQIKLPGGMCLLQQLPDETALPTDGFTPAVLSSLFQDLEQLGRSHAPVAEVDMDGLLQQQAGLDKLTLSPPPPSQQQQQQQLEVVQWGDWSAAGQQQQQRQQQQQGAAAAAAGAGLLLQVHQLHQQAERMPREGHAAAAVKLCQAALAAADGTGPQPAVRAPSAAAVAAAEGGELSHQLAPTSGTGSFRVALGGQHVLRIRVLAAQLCAAVDAAEWQLALQTARQLTPLYQLVYPKVRQGYRRTNSSVWL
jgi:hypothetical protein